MYTQQEASLLRQKFWVSMGRYISPIPSSTGEKVNWINYRTGIKYIQFKMEAKGDEAYIGIEISHPQLALRELYFNHFKTFQKSFEEQLEEKWQWEINGLNENGESIARIYKKLQDVKVLDENDWPKIISFLKTRIILLDKFWNEYKDIFEMLA